jgi:DNA-binding NtrC family response regulator
MIHCKTQTILLVDDEPALLNVISAVLEREGYRCIPAGHPTKALSLCESDEVIDFVVTDFNMPEMNGLQLWHRIQQVRPGLRVLFISGNSEVCESLCAKGLPCLVKPFQFAKLVSEIREKLAPMQDERGA